MCVLFWKCYRSCSAGVGVLALNPCWLEVEKQDGVGTGRSTVCFWGVSVLLILQSCCSMGLPCAVKGCNKGWAIGQRSVSWMLIYVLGCWDQSGALLRKNELLLAPFLQCVVMSWGPEWSQLECEHPLIPCLQWVHCHIWLSSCPSHFGATSCKALPLVCCLVLDCYLLSIEM